MAKRQDSWLFLLFIYTMLADGQNSFFITDINLNSLLNKPTTFHAMKFGNKEKAGN